MIVWLTTFDSPASEREQLNVLVVIRFYCASKYG